MKIYVLIYEENSDTRCGADVIHFATENEAVEAMREKYKASLKNLNHDETEHRDGYDCCCTYMTATIIEGEDSYYWRIEAREIEVPAPRIAVEVIGGMVQNVYADADVSVDVFDLDVSDFPEDGEADDAENRGEELKAFCSRPDVKQVW